MAFAYLQVISQSALSVPVRIHCALKLMRGEAEGAVVWVGIQERDYVEAVFPGRTGDHALNDPLPGRLQAPRHQGRAREHERERVCSSAPLGSAPSRGAVGKCC